MRYALAVDVKLIQLPDEPEPMPTPRPGDDPIEGMMKMGTALLASAATPVFRPPAFMGQPAGFDFRKEIAVSVHDFRGLAAIIERFDSLVSDIETEKLSA